MLVPALLFGGAVAFLLLPVSSRLPLWLGKEERVVFSISEENDKEQRWEATTDTKMTFGVHTRTDAGARQTVAMLLASATPLKQNENATMRRFSERPCLSNLLLRPFRGIFR